LKSIIVENGFNEGKSVINSLHKGFALKKPILSTHNNSEWVFYSDVEFV